MSPPLGSRRINVAIARHTQTGLLFAFSRELPGFQATAPTIREIQNEVPNLISAQLRENGDMPESITIIYEMAEAAETASGMPDGFIVAHHLIANVQGVTSETRHARP